MTRSKIQKIKFFVFLLIFLLAQSAVCDGRFRESRDTPESTVIDKVLEKTVKTNNAHISSPPEKSEQKNIILSAGTATSASNKTVESITPKHSGEANKTTQATVPYKGHLGEKHAASLNTGALLRGFYAFVGLSVLVMAYIVFRSFRLNKSRAQMVRKYGVLAHRQDVEMRPLPLEEEDDEDTTVFDASNVLTNNVQHQNL